MKSPICSCCAGRLGGIGMNENGVDFCKDCWFLRPEKHSLNVEPIGSGADISGLSQKLVSAVGNSKTFQSTAPFFLPPAMSDQRHSYYKKDTTLTVREAISKLGLESLVISPPRPEQAKEPLLPNEKQKVLIPGPKGNQFVNVEDLVQAKVSKDNEKSEQKSNIDLPEDTCNDKKIPSNFQNKNVPSKHENEAIVEKSNIDPSEDICNDKKIPSTFQNKNVPSKHDNEAIIQKSNIAPLEDTCNDNPSNKPGKSLVQIDPNVPRVCFTCGVADQDMYFLIPETQDCMCKDCFKCAECGKPLEDTGFVRVEKGLIHLECVTYEKCNRCEKDIKGRYVMRNGAKIHTTCFKCSSCGVELSGSPFFIKREQEYCGVCTNKN